MITNTLKIDWFKVPNWVKHITLNSNGTFRYHENPIIFNSYKGEYESDGGRQTIVECPPFVVGYSTTKFEREIDNDTIKKMMM